MTAITITTEDPVFADALRAYCVQAGHDDIAVAVGAGGGLLHIGPDGGPGLALPVRLGLVIDRARALAAPEQAERAFGDCVLQMHEAVLRRGTQVVRLTEKERDILAALHDAGAAGMERQALLEAVWGYSAAVETHTLETHIYRLRQKIESDPAQPALLLTDERGYRLFL
jgi:DNA-binding response OmpR family regulator